MNEKCEKLKDKNIIYVFVNLKKTDELPEFYVVPSKVVAETTTVNHKKWLNGKGRNSQKRNDSSMRKFRDLDKVYLNRWDLLNL